MTEQAEQAKPPELPRPEVVGWCGAHDSFPIYGHTADQMRAFYAAGVAAERERAAKICEAERVDAAATGDATDAAYNLAAEHCAKAIRATKEG